MGDSRIKDVSSLLSSFFDEEKLRRGERYSDFFSSWPALVGSRLAAHSRVADVDKGILVVEAEHPGWIQLLQLRQSGILDAVARRFPELGLRGIVFRLSGRGGAYRSQAVASREEGREGEKVAEDAPPPASDEEKNPDEPSRAEEIDDPEFRALFTSLKKTMRGKD
jgi:hypothetical protein